jgi:hypothetical protein
LLLQHQASTSSEIEILQKASTSSETEILQKQKKAEGNTAKTKEGRIR